MHGPITATGGPQPLTLRIDLGCAGGNHGACAPALQPGDACKSHGAACAVGTYCQSAPGSCGGDGSCVVAPTASCPHLGLLCRPVCGCDGNTYCQDTGCPIAKARTSVAYVGECACDFDSTQVTADTDVGRTWADDSGVLTYQISPNEPFFTLTVDHCANHPGCEAPIFQLTGSWSVNGSNVTLTFDNATRPTEHYDYQTDCNGSPRLFPADPVGRGADRTIA